MKRLFTGILSSFIVLSVAKSACNTSDLEKCIDSVCAVNIKIDAGARCRLCGTSDARKPINSKSSNIYSSDTPTFKELNLGKTKTDKSITLNPNEAPDAPSEKYAYAVNQCISKISGCDVSDIKTKYDNLIGESCKSAAKADGIENSAKITEKSENECIKQVRLCMYNDDKCGNNLVLCGKTNDGALYNKSLSACLISVGGCNGKEGSIGKALNAELKSVQNEIKQTKSDYKKQLEKKRTEKLNTITNTCKSGFSKCQANMCQNTESNCSNAKDLQMAKKMCEYVNIACQVMK